MADLFKVRRNVSRMVDQGAPDTDIDEYVRAEGTSLGELKAHKARFGASGIENLDFGKPKEDVRRQIAEIPESARPEALKRWADTAVAKERDDQGALAPLPTRMPIVTPLAQRAGAAVSAGINALSGGSYGRPYDEALAFEQARLRAAEAAHPTLSTVGHVASTFSLPMPAPAASLTGRMMQNALYGGGISAAEDAFDAEGGAADKAAAAGQGFVRGAVTGAVLTPAIEGGARALGAGNALAKRALGISPAQRAENAARLQELKDAGITNPLGTIVSEGRIQDATGRGLASSVFGRDLREAAAQNIDQGVEAAQRALQTRAMHAPVADNAADVQRLLRRNLTEYSIPSRELEQMSAAEIERLTGPLSETGFRPPRPVVQPIPPEPVAPVAPRRVTPQDVNVSDVPLPPRPEIKPNYPRFEDVAIPPEMQKAVSEAEIALRQHQEELAKVTRPQIEAAARKHGITSDDVLRVALEQQKKVEAELAALEAKAKERGYPSLRVAQGMEAKYGRGSSEFTPKEQYHPLHQQALALEDAASRSETLTQALEQARNAAAQARSETWRTAARKAYDEEATRANAEYGRASSQARQKAIDDALAKAQADENARVAAMNAQARTRAEAEAKRATAEAQQRADAEWANTPSGFRLGRTKETYPTEYSAAEERISRPDVMPQFRRNPLGGRNMGQEATTAVERLINDIGLEARQASRLPGYKGRIWEKSGEMNPGLKAHLEELFGPDVSLQIENLATKRQLNQFPPGPQGIRKLLTSVGDAARQAEKPLLPGMTRTADAAALRRLEGALQADMYRFMREAGPKGERAAQMTQDMRAQYADFINQMRRPLGKLIGTDAKPVEAIAAADRLGQAFADGNLQTIRPFMRVLMEKGEVGTPERAVATVIQHMTNGAKSIPDFMKGFGAISRDTRNEIFVTPGLKSLRTQLESLEKVLPRLERYEKAVNQGGALDLSSRGNLTLGIAAFMHWPTALLTAGGSHLLARFMASPRYVNWLTRTPNVSNPAQMRAHMRQLVLMANNDKDLGDAVRDAVGDMVMPKAKAGVVPGRESATNTPDDRMPAIREDLGPVTKPGDVPSDVAAGVSEIKDRLKLPDKDAARLDDLLWTDEFADMMVDIDVMSPGSARTARVRHMMQRLEDLVRSP